MLAPRVKTKEALDPAFASWAERFDWHCALVRRFPFSHRCDCDTIWGQCSEKYSQTRTPHSVCRSSLGYLPIFLLFFVHPLCWGTFVFWANQSGGDRRVQPCRWGRIFPGHLRYHVAGSRELHRALRPAAAQAAGISVRGPLVEHAGFVFVSWIPTITSSPYKGNHVTGGQ